MDVFYSPPNCIHDLSLIIEGDEYHHLLHVMRKIIGDELFVADGEGVMYRVKIASISSSETTCDILERMPNYNEPSRELILVQAILKNPNRMDWIIEKATELGVHEIFPVIMERTIAVKNKIDRWKHIALAAMKQSVRCKLPEIHEVSFFHDVISRFSSSHVFLCHEKSDDRTIKSVMENIYDNNPIVLCIGPEGGFGEDEIDLARNVGAKILSLGSTRLRSETAAIVALARMTEYLK